MTPPSSLRFGLASATLAYVLWGVLPLYFKLLGDVSPLAILAHRIVWSVPAAAALTLAAGKWRDARSVLLARPQTLFALLASGLVVATNWGIYIWAVANQHVLDGSLGYYINPLITFAIAAAFFGERFNRWQLAAFGLTLAGVLNQTWTVGRVPWVSLALALSFAVYGAIRKQVRVDARVGFMFEAAWLAPAALIYLIRLPPENVAAFNHGDPGRLWLLAAAGPITAAPLILFAFGAQRLKLSTIGMLQYILPTLQLGIGLALGEPFTLGHVLTFALIWSGVLLFSAGVIRAERARAGALSGA